MLPTHSPILLNIFSGSERGDSGGGVGGPVRAGEARRARQDREGKANALAGATLALALASRASPGASPRQ